MSKRRPGTVPGYGFLHDRDYRSRSFVGLLPDRWTLRSCGPNESRLGSGDKSLDDRSVRLDGGHRGRPQPRRPQRTLSFLS